MEKITADQVVSLESLVALLGSSESTVRRDLDELEHEGRLRRVHGGAELLSSLGKELSNREKSVKNIQEKEALARAAYALIKDGDIIFIDAGTTTAFLIELLVEQAPQDLIVVTNSIHHASRLVERGVKTMNIGGFVKERTNASVGSFALRQIESLNVDKAFIGMNGVDQSYLTTPDPEEALIKRAIIDNAKTSYALVDVSKLGQYTFVKVAELKEVILVTNRTDRFLLQEIKKKTRVIEV